MRAGQRSAAQGDHRAHADVRGWRCVAKTIVCRRASSSGIVSSGRVAEELIFGHDRVTTGAASGIRRQRRSLACQYVTHGVYSPRHRSDSRGRQRAGSSLGRNSASARGSPADVLARGRGSRRVMEPRPTSARATLRQQPGLLHRCRGALLGVRRSIRGIEMLSRGGRYRRARRRPVPPARTHGAAVTRTSAQPTLLGGPEPSPA
jgi:cell division protease FtsH